MKLALYPLAATSPRTTSLLNSLSFGPVTAWFKVMGSASYDNDERWVKKRRRSGTHGGGIVMSSRETMMGVTVEIRDKWREYQGGNDWEDLLDPLDENLRSEILRYGEFVKAAYQSFELDPSSEYYGSCKFSRNSLLARAGVLGSGYCLTKNLRATCGVWLPRWVDIAPGWMTTRSSWIGYVAVCQDRKEIARLGRRDIVIALRGTGTCLEWIENLRTSLTCPYGSGLDDTPMVQSGFWSLYASRTDNIPSLQDMIREEVARVVAMYAQDNVPISLTLTGHSLGAALATLAAYDIRAGFEGETNAPMVTVFSFGGPRVGNWSFRSHLESGGTKILRVVNSDDPVTKVPGFMPANDAADHMHVEGLLGWLRRGIQGDPRRMYADLGQELRLSSKESPYLDKRDVIACHDLGTYLHLVDGFEGSACPFRATARKMLRRMHHHHHH